MISFTGPYVLIEGFYLVRDDSPVKTSQDVDQPHNRVAVGKGSAYDLFLTRELKAAQILRAPTSPTVVQTFLSLLPTNNSRTCSTELDLRRSSHSCIASVSENRKPPTAYVSAQALTNLRQESRIPPDPLCDLAMQRKASFLQSFMPHSHVFGQYSHIPLGE
jgi:hypothetical protein